MYLVLCIDRHPASGGYLTSLMRKAGHQARYVEDFRRALDYILDHDVSLVIFHGDTDEREAYEFCQVVRRHSVGYVYLIALTGQSWDPESTLPAYCTLADDFLRIPWVSEELLARVHAGLRVVGLQTRDAAIVMMAKLAESRTHENGFHLERIRSYSKLLALGLSKRPEFSDQLFHGFSRLIYWTSPLHDIGKVAVPDRILLKPGKLTAAEFEIMKTHTTIGADTIDKSLKHFPNVDFLLMAREIALHHHERYDGSGYPDRLSGDEIPLAARIVAVADVYDALTTHRIYKQRLSTHDEARAIMIEESGHHFDPCIIDVFIEFEEEFQRIHAELSDPLVPELELACQLR